MLWDNNVDTRPLQEHCLNSVSWGLSIGEEHLSL
jgi:hypothetical protein